VNIAFVVFAVELCLRLQPGEEPKPKPQPAPMEAACCCDAICGCMLLEGPAGDPCPDDTRVTPGFPCGVNCEPWAYE
jgi:hypothetical protein